MSLVLLPFLLIISNLNFAALSHENNGLDSEYSIDRNSMSDLDIRRRRQNDAYVPTLDDEDDGGLAEDIIEMNKRRGWGKRFAPDRMRQVEWALRSGYEEQLVKRKGWGKRAGEYWAMNLSGQLSEEKRKGWGKRGEGICDSMARSIAELYQTMQQIHSRLAEENCAQYLPTL